MLLHVKTNGKDSVEILTELITDNLWLICCTASDPDDMSTYVLENVTRLDREGYWSKHFNRDVFIEYGISPAINKGEYPYRIHDSVMQPILDDSNLDSLVKTLVSVFDVVLIDQGLVDRVPVYGKLGTPHENEIVFINDKI